MQKPFDRTLYNEFDSKAKTKITNLINKHTNLKVIDPILKTDVDLLVYREGEYLFNIEVEVKAVWQTKEFPYENVQFPARKIKYCNLDKPTLFVMFNSNLDNYLCVLSEDLRQSPVKMVRNRYVKFGEEFFQVPLEKVYFNSLKTAITKLGVKL